MHNLLFQCNEACKETFPLKELFTHKQRGLCYRGYKRPVANPSPLPIAQSQIAPA